MALLLQTSSLISLALPSLFFGSPFDDPSPGLCWVIWANTSLGGLLSLVLPPGCCLVVPVLIYLLRSVLHTIQCLRQFLLVRRYSKMLFVSRSTGWLMERLLFGRRGSFMIFYDCCMYLIQAYFYLGRYGVEVQYARRKSLRAMVVLFSSLPVSTFEVHATVQRRME